MMHRFTSLLALALSLSTNAQNFQGSPGGGATEGRVLNVPDCAKSCVTTPHSNYVNEFQSFCQAVPSKACCIINACGPDDVDATNEIANTICQYVGIDIAAFTCASTSTSSSASKHTTSSLHSSTHTTSTAHSTSSTHSTSSKHSTSTTHTTSSAHSTSTTHTTSSAHSTSTSHSTLLTSIRSTSKSSQKSTSTTSKTSSKTTSTRPTSTAPASPLSTLSVYDGYVGAYCYSEGTTGLTLNDTSSTSSTMTIESCLDTCEKSGWRFAGLENGNSCYCGSDIQNGGATTAASACNMGCAGKPTENCGGKKALSVYESG